MNELKEKADYIVELIKSHPLLRYDAQLEYEELQRDVLKVIKDTELRRILSSGCSCGISKRLKVIDGTRVYEDVRLKDYYFKKATFIADYLRDKAARGHI